MSYKHVSIKSIEIENEGNKYDCNIQIINEILNIYINVNNTVYKGNISLGEIKNQIRTFKDYNIKEIFEEINILNNDNFKLKNENNDIYKLEIKFIILRRNNYLYINLYNNLTKSKLKEIIKNQDKTNKSLKDNFNKLNNNYINNNFDIKLKEQILVINNHEDSVYSFTILKDGRLVSGSYDTTIKIYNKKTYQPEIIIKEHKGPINCIITLSSGILASCSWDTTIKLFNIKENKYEIIQILQYHVNKVYHIIELKNKSLASCSNDNSIIFYNKDNNNKYIEYHKIITNDYCFSIIETKDNEICYSQSNNKIYFYDLIQKKIKSELKINTNCYTIDGFIMISKDLLIIPGICEISIININNYSLKVIPVPNSSHICCVCMLNEKLLLTGDESNTIRQFKIEGDNLTEVSKKENAHHGIIFCITKSKDGHIISGSADKSIKIY